MSSYNFLREFTSNGWHWDFDPDSGLEAFERYSITIMGEFEGKVQAVVSQRTQNICNEGHFGVIWLEISEYECEMPYTMNDIEDMALILKRAENNLSKLGIPFVPDYTWLSDDAEEKQKKNDAIREQYDFEAQEKEALDFMKKKREEELKKWKEERDKKDGES